MKVSLAKYQPSQEAEGPTSPRALFRSEELGPAQFEIESFPFIRTSGRSSAASTEPEAPGRASVVEMTQVPEEIRRIFGVPRFSGPDYRLQLLQQWECVVRSIDREEFVAILHDMTDPSKAEEEAIFPLEEVPDSDRAFVEPGAVFYWSIGYRTSSAGQKDRISQIRFRRLPTWTASERREARARASEFEELLDESKR
jgi:hypothetical protein